MENAIIHRSSDLAKVLPIQARFADKGLPCRLVAVEEEPDRAAEVTRGVLAPSDLPAGRVIYVNIAESRARIGKNKVVRFVHHVAGAVIEKNLSEAA